MDAVEKVARAMAVAHEGLPDSALPENYWRNFELEAHVLIAEFPQLALEGREQVSIQGPSIVGGVSRPPRSQRRMVWESEWYDGPSWDSPRSAVQS